MNLSETLAFHIQTIYREQKTLLSLTAWRIYHHSSDLLSEIHKTDTHAFPREPNGMGLLVDTTSNPLARGHRGPEIGVSLCQIELGIYGVLVWI